MWVITVFLYKRIQMFEFDNEAEAKKRFEKMNETKILTQLL
ncbi:hypothetical protein [Domibacillus sp. A3M-37]|nr:hypothetical protein [Domibacillus sp. A3M-37]